RGDEQHVEVRRPDDRSDMPEGNCTERHDRLRAAGARQPVRGRPVAERAPSDRHDLDATAELHSITADDHAAVTEDARRRGADALVMVGGAVLVASAFVHWVSRGSGSGLRGHALVDALIADERRLPGVSETRLTILWYLVPAIGASCWVATGLGGAGRRAERNIGVQY